MKTSFFRFIDFGSISALILFKTKPKKGFNSLIELLKFSLHKNAAFIL